MLRAILTRVPSDSRPRYKVGVAGTAPSGLEVYRPGYLLRGPWCKSTARQHAARLQRELDRGIHGHLLGWQKTADAM
jgi:hypothetical protein